MSDGFSELSEEDRAKLVALEAEWKRDGEVALTRFAEKDPVAYFRIIEAIHPKAARAAIEHALIENGLTNADIRALAEKAKYKN